MLFTLTGSDSCMIDEVPRNIKGDEKRADGICVHLHFIRKMIRYVIVPLAC
jgi:hypothetical protein